MGGWSLPSTPLEHSNPSDENPKARRAQIFQPVENNLPQKDKQNVSGGFLVLTKVNFMEYNLHKATMLSMVE